MISIIFGKIADEAAGFVIGKLLDWGVTKAFQSDFTAYEKELSSIINQTIEEYEKLYPIKEDGKIAFYTSQVLFEELLRFRFTAQFNKQRIVEVVSSDSRVMPFSETQMLKFFEILNFKIDSSENLKFLNIESNYKEEIFRISETVNEGVNKILNSIEDLKRQLNKRLEIAALVEEWSIQLDEVLDNMEAFKPFTAQERLQNLERRIIKEGLDKDEKILSRIYYLQAICLEQTTNSDISEVEAKLLIKAYNYNKRDSEYKSNAALSYYVLGELEKAKQLSEELLLDDEFDNIGWCIKCFLKENHFREVLDTVPFTVKKDRTFKLHLFHWLFFHKYVNTILEFDNLGLSLEINTDEEPIVTYSNKHYTLDKINCLLHKFYQKQVGFSVAIYFPNVKSDNEFVYANKMLKELVRTIKGSEVEKLHHYYIFQFYCTCLALDGNVAHVFEMEKEYKQLNSQSIETVSLMARAYNNLNNDEGTSKAIQIIEEYKGKKNEYLLLLCFINYSFLKNSDKIQEYFLKYLDAHPKVDRNCILNIASFIKQGKIGLTDIVKQKLESLIQNQSFENDGLKMVLRILLFIVFDSGFTSSEKFHEHLKETEKVVDYNDHELSICIVYGYMQINQLDAALNLLEKDISFEKPSEYYKLYCKILYNKQGHKPELLEHLKKWRNNFIPDYELLDMEAYLYQLQERWNDQIQVAEAGLKYYPNSQDLIYYLFSGLNKLSDLEKIKENVNLIEGKNFKEEYGVGISLTLLKAGLQEQALALFYKQASCKNHSKTRLSYITFLDHISRDLVIDYEIAEVGTFVQYKLNDKIGIVSINEDNKEIFPQNLLIGKKVRERFSFSQNMTGSIINGEILRVCDKHLALFEEILLDAENPMSGLGIHVMHFKDGDIESINKNLIENFGIKGSLEKDRVKEELDKYYSGKLSFTEITNSVFKRNFIDAYFILSNKDGKLFLSLPPNLGFNPNITDTTKFVLDFTSVCLFYELSKELKIEFKHKFVLSNLLREEVIRKIENAKSELATEISMTITKEGVRPYFYPKDYKEKRVDHFHSILSWIDKNCIVEFVPERLNLIMDLDEEKRQDPFFQLLIENRLLVDRSEFVLLTNDIVYFKYFPVSKNIILNPLHFLNRYHNSLNSEILNFLLHHNYTGLSITSDIMNVELINFLAGKENKFSICLENLKYSWNPNQYHLAEAVKFIKSLYLSSYLNDNKRQQVVISVLSNAIVGLPIELKQQLSNLLFKEFELLPNQLIEVSQILLQVFKIS